MQLRDKIPLRESLIQFCIDINFYFRATLDHPDAKLEKELRHVPLPFPTLLVVTVFFSGFIFRCCLSLM